MSMLVAGLVLFIGAHLVPTLPTLRARVARITGPGVYKVLFSLVSLAGLVLIFADYGQMQGMGRGNPQLWVPPTWTKHVTMLLMLPAMILLVAAYVPSRIRTATRHPMLAAVRANGDLASVVLFGSFLAYAVYERISVKRRGSLGPLRSAQGGMAQDVVVVVLGLALYTLLVFWGHAKMTGVPLLA